MSGVECHHRTLPAYMIDRCRMWHDITSFGQRTWSNDVERDMTSPPLERTHGRTTSGVACHHCLWAAQTVGRHRALHAIIAFVQHTQSNDIGRGMPSSPLGSTDSRAASGVACHHRSWTAQTVGRRRAWHAIIDLRQHTRSATSGVA